MYILGQDVQAADMSGVSVPVGCRKSEASLVDGQLLKKNSARCGGCNYLREIKLKKDCKVQSTDTWWCRTEK